MKIKILIGLCMLFLLIGCQTYGYYETHPCETPFHYDLDCDLAKSCLNNRFNDEVVSFYLDEKCSQNGGDSEDGK